MASKRRHRRIRRNPDNTSTVLVVGGLVVGGYFAWKYFNEKAPAAIQPAGASNAIVGGLRTTEPLSADGWAAYDRRRNKATDPIPLDRPAFERLWGSLTSDEKRLFVAMSVATDAEASAAMADPQRRGMIMGIVMKVMAAAPGAATRSSRPAVSGIGNYA